MLTPIFLPVLVPDDGAGGAFSVGFGVGGETVEVAMLTPIDVVCIDDILVSGPDVDWVENPVTTESFSEVN